MFDLFTQPDLGNYSEWTLFKLWLLAQKTLGNCDIFGFWQLDVFSWFKIEYYLLVRRISGIGQQTGLVEGYWAIYRLKVLPYKWLTLNHLSQKHTFIPHKHAHTFSHFIFGHCSLGIYFSWLCLLLQNIYFVLKHIFGKVNLDGFAWGKCL